MQARQNQMLETRKENLDLRRQKEQVEADMALQRQRWDHKNLVLETELDKVSIQLQAEREENENLKRDLSLIWSTHAACESVLDTVEQFQREAAKRFQLLQARADEGFRIRNEMDSLKGNLETANRRSKIMEAANEAKDAQIVCLNTDCEGAIQKYQSLADSLRDSFRDVPDLESKIRKADEQNNDLQSTILQLRLSQDKLLADHTRETTVLRNHIAELTTALRATEQEVSSAVFRRLGVRGEILTQLCAGTRSKSSTPDRRRARALFCDHAAQSRCLSLQESSNARSVRPSTMMLEAAGARHKTHCEATRAS
eukprot:3009854-Rhodomonas_salina.1